MCRAYVAAAICIPLFLQLVYNISYIFLSIGNFLSKTEGSTANLLVVLMSQSVLPL
jgi:hypothetical protein